ncbi:hypothetical protein BV898_13610 [Hypsibius exemplaris]|uniref:Uncharacterized protein n=1 Tax=Hypsibius exemplaris TaxID=2072580 RepID=A0A1W0WAB3_HYPEX|nr:hypothetical protein BV898_13610 [Hypsibius exemplaris]
MRLNDLSWLFCWVFLFFGLLGSSMANSKSLNRGGPVEVATVSLTAKSGKTAPQKDIMFETASIRGGSNVNCVKDPKRCQYVP